MKDNIRIEDTIAYKLGFEHGLKEGVDNNTFENDYDRHSYRIGYDAGVSEYCLSIKDDVIEA
jgi:hypothetical protein